ncbi:MAG: hypothetical protein HY975_02150 [Candidatus Kerfeldbacteria bacterium]|nr:hypothetical protein [Candidatus Kerfeldbacteria bacterium]
MYFYVFDNFLQDRRYESDVAAVETRLAQLGIQGRSEKITILKNIQEAVTTAIKRGATTVVAVGNDSTVSKVLPQVVEHNVTLGLIPIGPEQTIAGYLGIPAGAKAAEVLSRRVIRRLDLGEANDQLFLLNLAAPAAAAVTCDNKYTVTSRDPDGQLVITNFNRGVGSGRPDDGRLELVVERGEQRGWGNRRRGFQGSIFPFTKAKITCTGSPTVVLDGQRAIKPPVLVTVVPHRLEVIVGPQRSFE